MLLNFNHDSGTVTSPTMFTPNLTHSDSWLTPRERQLRTVAHPHVSSQQFVINLLLNSEPQPKVKYGNYVESTN